jgi:hypothetical protein
MSVSIETVGVLLTLLYLAFELRANNKIAMSNSHREISKQLSEWYSLLKNPETSLMISLRYHRKKNLSLILLDIIISIFVNKYFIWAGGN